MGFLVLRHTQEGQEILAKLLARKYVKRGARWLYRNAPRGWYRNCFNGDTSRIHMSYSSEGILGIAFEYCEEFADNSGYINEGKVLKHFDLWPFTKKASRLGFELPLNGFSPFSKFYSEIKITNEMLDVAWAECLKHIAAEWRIPYRHQTPLDRRFAEMKFLEDRPITFWDRLWSTLGVRSKFRTS